MHIAAYLVIALAFGISNMLLFRRCAELTPIRLTQGLWLSFFVGLTQATLFLGGMAIGNLLRFELPDNPDAFTNANALIFFGLTIFVMLHMLLPYLRREPKLPLFDLTNDKVRVALALTAAVNPLLVGLGVGFVASSAQFSLILPLVMWVLLWFFGYWGIMLGRRKVTLRPRRWMIVSCVLLLGVAIAAIVNA